MNILLMDGLPEEYDGIPISADFRNMIQVDLILKEPDLKESQKIIGALMQLYPELPSDIDKAVEGLIWFYTRGTESASGKDTKKPQAQKAYCFEQDANLIYAAFYATYNISLTTIDFLHWWEFMALFEGLPETTLMQRVMYWRTADLTGMPKQERAHILKMRKLFELKNTGTPFEVEDTRERLLRRFAEVERLASENKCK